MNVTVGFSLTWLTLPATGQSVKAANHVRSGGAALGGGYRIYGGGRVRLTSTPGDTRTLAVTLQGLVDADLATVLAWRGLVVLLRDANGWRQFGTYLDVKWTDLGYDTVGGMLHDVTLTVQQVNYIEAV